MTGVFSALQAAGAVGMGAGAQAAVGAVGSAAYGAICLLLP